MTCNSAEFSNVLVKFVRLLFRFYEKPDSDPYSDRLQIVVYCSGAFHFHRYYVPASCCMCLEHSNFARHSCCSHRQNHLPVLRLLLILKDKVVFVRN